MVYKEAVRKGICTGCGLCAYVCPIDCIEMVEDREGFLYPQIDSSRCTNCGICRKACSAHNVCSQNISIYRTIAAQLIDNNLLIKSASGGAFIGLAIEVIKNGGVVVGVVDDIKEGARFRIAHKIDDVYFMVGSKYFQCDLEVRIYEEIYSLLTKGIRVLFSGTPCQIWAIKNGIQEEFQENLFLVEIICQGVPSKKIVGCYHDYINRTRKKKVEQHYYRSKDITETGRYTTKLVYSTGEVEVKIGEADLYSRAFQRKIYLRESCYKCKFTNLHRVADVTIGDFWGLQSNKIDVKKGVSVILISTLKGEKLWESSKHLFISEEKVLADIVNSNKPLTASVKRPWYRMISYKMLDIIGFSLTTRLLCCRYYLRRLLKRK